MRFYQTERLRARIEALRGRIDLLEIDGLAQAIIEQIDQLPAERDQVVLAALLAAVQLLERHACEANGQPEPEDRASRRKTSRRSAGCSGQSMPSTPISPPRV